MDKFKVVNIKRQSINRSIRLSKQNFDKINIMAHATNVSFNRVVEMCIEYAIKNM